MTAKIEQIDSGGNGNTGTINGDIPPLKGKKQGIQAKKWCFTLNNYNKKEIRAIEQVLSTLCKKFIFQEEVGENGTEHLQGCFELYKKRRLTSIKKLINGRAHFERCRNWEASLDYCRKVETRNGDVFYKGVPRPIKVLNEKDLYKWQKDVIKIIEGPKDDRAIHWYYETKGNVGKSTFCKYIVVKHKALVLSGRARDMKYGIVRYMEKNGDYPELILIDVPRTSRKFLSYQGIEEIKNACFFSGKYEGDMVVGNCPTLVVFANFKPDRRKMSNDRWRIECIGEDKDGSDYCDYGFLSSE